MSFFQLSCLGSGLGTISDFSSEQLLHDPFKCLLSSKRPFPSFRLSCKKSKAKVLLRGTFIRSMTAFRHFSPFFWLFWLLSVIHALNAAWMKFDAPFITFFIFAENVSKIWKISRFFFRQTNLVPRVPSYPPALPGRVGENPGNEVAYRLVAFRDRVGHFTKKF